MRQSSSDGTKDRGEGIPASSSPGTRPAVEVVEHRFKHRRPTALLDVPPSLVGDEPGSGPVSGHGTRRLLYGVARKT